MAHTQIGTLNRKNNIITFNKNSMKREERYPSIKIHINNEPVSVAINLDVENGIIFKLSFYYKGKMFQKLFDPISTEGKLFSKEEIEFEEIELNDIDKYRIASRLNELLDRHFN